MMSEGHHPEVAQRTDGRFVVECSECRHSGGATPIGIDLPVADGNAAENIARNHRLATRTARAS